jgi:hypothetical protein
MSDRSSNLRGLVSRTFWEAGEDMRSRVLEGFGVRNNRQDPCLLHVVEIYINISIYYSSFNHVRKLEKTFVGQEHSYCEFL